ncbi:MAG: hypothetical protein GYA17_04900 [Chloroflexi bacterium]|jgi:hypothetical protein|nr:hypothetical protein [Anaerolineaceae bacterium]NMB87672.1 hypothetical protein [Chloroflexota bacterium]
MRTPAGFECRYFYGDYYRGRSQEECRLIGNAAPPHHWTPDICKVCPVPRIERANACQNMKITPTVQRGLFGLKKSIKIHTYCTLSQQEVAEPEVGCGQCHPLPPIFTESK